jgi:hypothetical protein
MQALAMERPLTRDLRGDGAPLDLRAYEKVGGYRGVVGAGGEWG